MALNVHVKSFPDYWNNTAHTQKNDGANLTDVSFSYKPAPGVVILASVENIGHVEYFDQGYGYVSTNAAPIFASGTNLVVNPFPISTSTIPSLGQPLTARISIKGEF